jgi:transcriptional regulator GlxA family with amidase domain
MAAAIAVAFRFVEEGDVHVGVAGPRSLRRALAFIDDHAGEPITLAEIAAAAGLSPRGLQDAFRRRLGSTPMAELQRVRLAGAHDELEREDPASARVEEIARRWGFAHPSRFAAVYRRQYGELPSQTLRR